MKSKYSFEKKEEYLYLIISGEYDKRDFLSYPKMIKEECEKEKIYKVLLDALALKGTNAPKMDRFFIGEEVAKTLGPGIKLAAAWPEKDIDKLAEIVAINRGGNIYVHGDLETAKDWLLNTY